MNTQIIKYRRIESINLLLAKYNSFQVYKFIAIKHAIILMSAGVDNMDSKGGVVQYTN